MTRGAVVQWEPTGRRVSVPTDKPLLFGLLDAGLPLAFACMQGHCGTCRASLTDGAVHHAPATRKEDGAVVLLCTAYPASAYLSLALHP